MSDVRAAIASHLIHDSQVALIVDGRVFSMVTPPRTAFPYITYQVISTDHVRHMTNVSGLVDRSVQINCWGRVETVVRTLADAVRKSLDHLNHRNIGRGANLLEIRAAFLENEIDDYTPSPRGDESGIFRIIMEWSIWHTETLPVLAV